MKLFQVAGNTAERGRLKAKRRTQNAERGTRSAEGKPKYKIQNEKWNEKKREAAYEAL